MQPEIFPRELGRRIVKAEEIRHASDCDTFYIASKEITSQQIETAAIVIQKLTCQNHSAKVYRHTRCQEQIKIRP